MDWGTCCRDLCVFGRLVVDWGTCAGDPSGDPAGSLWQRACTLGVRGEPATAVTCCIGVQSKLERSRSVDWGTSPTWAWTGGLVICVSRFDLSRVDLDRSQAVESAPRTIPKLCWGRVQEGRVSGWAGGGVVDWGTCESWTEGLGSELVRPVLG